MISNNMYGIVYIVPQGLEFVKRNQLQFIGELAMYFSVHVDRKVPKERPLRESPTVPPLRNPPPNPHDSFALRKSLTARVVAKTQRPARTAERRSCGTRPFASAPSCSFSCRIKEKPWVATKRVNIRAVVTLTAVRLSGKLRLYSVSAHLPLANEHADQAIGSLRKVPWVLSLRGVLLVLFFRHGKKSTQKKPPTN